MTRWVRFRNDAHAGFGVLDGETIAEHQGDMFAGSHATSRVHALSDVALLTPCLPSKMLGLWRNYRQLSAKMGTPDPKEPLYFIKASSSFLAPFATIRQPSAFDGTVIFEGELGVVIGKRATAVGEADAHAHIFGYTCVNDVTGTEPLQDAVFPHWTRAKGFDTFGPFGPCIQTAFDWRQGSLRTRLDGVERQHYPFSDMVMTPEVLVSRLSFDMTLMPGDVIALGTSIGAGRLKPGSTVEIEIAGIGTLSNRYAARDSEPQ